MEKLRPPTGAWPAAEAQAAHSSSAPDPGLWALGLPLPAATGARGLGPPLALGRAPPNTSQRGTSPNLSFEGRHTQKHSCCCENQVDSSKVSLVLASNQTVGQRSRMEDPEIKPRVFSHLTLNRGPGTRVEEKPASPQMEWGGRGPQVAD